MAGESHIDEIDKRILFHLARDARNTAASEIASEVDVTPATIRNRIRQLEERGIVRGYEARIDYERANGLTTTQFTCTASLEKRQRLSQETREIPGVVSVRELLSGRENILVTAITRDANDTSRIGQELSKLGLDVEKEDRIHNEYSQPYHPFGPDQGSPEISLADFRNLSGGAEVVEFTVSESADIVGKTIQETSESGVLEDVLVVNIERGEEMLTPKGDTEIHQGDVVTIFSQDGLADETIEAFNSTAEAGGGKTR